MAWLCKRRTAVLIDRLQNVTQKGKGGTAGHSTHGKMGLWTACKEETLAMKNILIESSGRKIYVWVEENCID
jgi:hypothetical protein